MSIAELLPALAQDVPDDSVVTPGIGGFAVFFFLAVVVFFLARSLGKHMRRARTNAAQQAQADAVAEAAGEAVGDAGTGDAATGAAGSAGSTGSAPADGSEPPRP